MQYIEKKYINKPSAYKKTYRMPGICNNSRAGSLARKKSHKPLQKSFRKILPCLERSKTDFNRNATGLFNRI